MKKFLMILCTLMMVLGVTGMAGAVPITFSDTTLFTSTGTINFADYDSHGGGDVNFIGDVANDFVMWTHYYEFDPAAAEVLSGKLTIWLSDNEDDDPFEPITWELGKIWTEDGFFDVIEVDTGPYGYNVIASYLDDGTFTVRLASVFGGDFYIGQSDLEITYNPVPEPTTILLLGSGLLGLVGYNRKRFSKKS